MGKMQGAIAAGHPKTAEAGVAILQAGGNVFDAVVASALAACVAEPTLTSLGGGGFLLAHTADNHNLLFDFFAHTPRQAPTQPGDFYPVDVDFGSVVQEFHIGLGAIAVPGMVKGLFQVHQHLGRLPLRVVAEPAIQDARNGVAVNGFQSYCFKILSPILRQCPELGPRYVPNGTPLPVGATLTSPAMADALEYLVTEGDRGFYEGDMARQLVRDCQERGGYLTLADLQSYEVAVRSPLSTQYRGNTLLTNPPPSSGGTLIAFALALLEQVELGAIAFGSSEHLRLLSEVMRLTNQARADGYDRHLYSPTVAQTFLAPDHLNPYATALQSVVNKWGSTTHISAIDSEGNAASLTSSNGEGSGYSIPGTGIMLNNMLGEADLHPGGFHQWQPDVRISSMMAPTMVLRDGHPELVLGSGGSNRIRTAILQVISNLLDFGMSVEDAVSSPRIHWENQVFSLEPGLTFPEGGFSREGEADQVCQWEEQNMFFGGVHAVGMDAAGQMTGGGDRRRSGVVALTSFA